MDCGSQGSSVHGILQAGNAGVGSHALLQGIFPTQGLNLGFLHCRWILYQLSHQGSPNCPQEYLLEMLYADEPIHMLIQFKIC